jgi:hypothetical protein
VARIIWRGEVHTGFGYGYKRPMDCLEYIGIYGNIILKWILNRCYVGMDWIDLTEDRKRWRSLVKTAMNILVL